MATYDLEGVLDLTEGHLVVRIEPTELKPGKTAGALYVKNALAEGIPIGSRVRTRTVLTDRTIALWGIPFTIECAHALSVDPIG